MKKAIIITVLSIFFSGTVFAEFGEIDIHGFISQGFLQSDDHKYLLADTDDGTFEFNEIGINFATDATDNLRLGMQIMARDLGSVGNDKVDIDWAYADYRYRNWAGLRIGKIKKPYGIYNQSRDVDAARTSILLPSCIYEEKFREAALTVKGASIYGSLPGSIDYQLMYGVMTFPSEGGVEQGIEQMVPTIRIGSIDTEAEFNGEIIWNTPLDGVRIGYAYSEFTFTLNINESYISDPAILAYMQAAAEAAAGVPAGTYAGAFPANWYAAAAETVTKGDNYIVSLEYTYDNFLFAVEYSSSTMEFGGSETDAENYYALASYRFTDLFELGLYYSVHYPDKDDKDGDRYAGTAPKEKAWLKDLALSLRFDINDYWIFKLEGHMMDGLSDVNYSESDDAVDPDPDWYMFAAKLSYSF